MNDPAARRLVRDLQDLKTNDVQGISAAPVSEDNFLIWNATIEGPPDSPYQGGVFRLEMKFPPRYPFKPPDVKFTTRVYHPNINSEKGFICLDTLQGQWAPGMTVRTVLLSIQALLTDPNPASPLEQEAAQLFISDRAAYNQKVREWVQRYASSQGIDSAPGA